MKTHRLLILCVAALLGTAPSRSLSAADFVVDISSFAPRDPEVILRQIDLNVALKQYEKAQMDLYDARLQYEIGTTDAAPTDDKSKAKQDRSRMKLKCLEENISYLRSRITHCIQEANEKAQAIEKAKAASVPAKDEPRG